jgi:hypothetical protein
MKQHTRPTYSVDWWDCLGFRHRSLASADYYKAVRRQDTLSASLRAKIGILRRVDIMDQSGASVGETKQRLPTEQELRDFYAKLYDPANLSRGPTPPQ